MKKVIRCLGCSNVVRELGGHSYKVELVETTKSILTGEVKQTEVEGRICRQCAQMAGYKIKKYDNLEGAIAHTEKKK